MKGTMLQEAAKIQEQLVSWRRDLHQIPEVDIHLPQTVAYLTERLDEMGIRYEVYEDSSNIVAQIGKGDKCFMLRGDTDGLPVVEETELDFASTNGCMHGCGHDMHATALLGAAKLLKQHEEELDGVVKLLFQSGEETFHGAKAALSGGVLENPHVDAAFALHVFASLPNGEIHYGKNPMSAVYGFKITLTGHGGHGSTPELCIDPINAGVAVYEAMQSLIARENVPAAESALTIGQFLAGNAANVIPERCVLQGTLRTSNKKMTEYLTRRINEIVPAIAAAYRTECEIEEISNVPNVFCDEALTEECLASVKDMVPETEFIGGFHAMGSEDFAVFSEKVPGTYFIVGAGVEDESKRLAQHNPKTMFNEDCLSLCSAIHAKVAMDWLAAHRQE